MLPTRDSLQLQGHIQAQREEVKKHFMQIETKESRGNYNYNRENRLEVKN